MSAASETHPAESKPSQATSMEVISILFRREFFGYFRTPVAYVCLVIFHFLVMGLTWQLFDFFDANSASLQQMFNFWPYVFLVLAPGVGMRLWAEEKRSGTWELLFTYPIETWQAVVAKFLGGWAFLTTAILLTVTMPMTAMYLGDPDLGPMITGYLGAIFMAGSYLAVCSLASSITRSQVVGFVLGVAGCFILLFTGLDLFTAWFGNFLPAPLVDGLANFSFFTHFEPFTKGMVRLTDIVFFLSVAVFSLWMNAIVLER